MPDIKTEIAALTQAQRELFEERAAIMEFCGNMPRGKAEELAMRDVRKQSKGMVKA